MYSDLIINNRMWFIYNLYIYLYTIYILLLDKLEEGLKMLKRPPKNPISSLFEWHMEHNH